MDIRYYLVKNATDTAAKAPYTVRVVPNGVANLNDLVAEILTRISSSEQRVRMALAEAAKVMLKHVLAGETVDFGGIRFKAQIPGSMDYEDSPFEPGVDEVVVCAYADDELRGTFDGIVPAKLSAEEVAASVKVSNVMDVATERFGEIHGTAPFKVLGNGVTLDGEGESAKLLDKKTGEALATAGVTTVSKGQRATCALGPVAGGIARGAYVLEVTTFGLVGETAPLVEGWELPELERRRGKRPHGRRTERREARQSRSAKARRNQTRTRERTRELQRQIDDERREFAQRFLGAVHSVRAAESQAAEPAGRDEKPRRDHRHDDRRDDRRGRRRHGDERRSEERHGGKRIHRREQLIVRDERGEDAKRQERREDARRRRRQETGDQAKSARRGGAKKRANGMRKRANGKRRSAPFRTR